MKHLQLYEEFSKDEFNILINNDTTYLRNFTKYIKNSTMLDIKEKIKGYDFNKFKKLYDGFELTIYPDDNFKQFLCIYFWFKEYSKRLFWRN